jgi:argininosuccinate lyase
MLWGGRFSGGSADVTKRISSSVHFDGRMYEQDIEGSKAHARMLGKMGVLKEDEVDAVVRGLDGILNDIGSGKFVFSEELEDVHMNIESELTRRIGDAGKRLHTARSRNDQVALDMRLYLRKEISAVRTLITGLMSIIVGLSEKNMDAVMPGYTHLQVAQPVRFSHHVLVYAWQLARDLERLSAAERACGSMPLGSGALAGVNYGNDREFLMKELGFDRVAENSMDAVSDRDFALDFLYFASVLGSHLSRFCEELVLWSSSEFGYIRLADGVTTGSSIMPQKRNPDVAELIRGKSGRLYGNLFSLLTIMKGLPLAYNRDMQEDKEPLFDSVDTVKICLEGMAEMLSGMEVNARRMKESVYRNYSTATDVADYLVGKGVPFRESHEIVGRIVAHCEEKGLDFFNLDAKTLRGFSGAFGDDAVGYFNPESSVERKVSAGGTSGSSVKGQAARLREIIKLYS